MRRFHSIRIILSLGLAVLPWALCTQTQAATLTVTATADSGPGSLRAALAGAINGDQIVFSLGIPSTILLTNGELLITNNVTLAGPGATNLFISGNTTNRIFHIATNGLVNISGMTIRDGHGGGDSGADGGGIFNAGTLTVSNCVVAFNRAADITVFGSAGGGNGGGIFNVGMLTVVGCTFQSNVGGTGIAGRGTGAFGGLVESGGPGGNGGAIYNGGTLSVIACTFYDNHAGAGGPGGGTSIGGYAAQGGTGGGGGAIFNTGSMTCIACTLSGNQAGAGGQGGLAFSVFSGGYGGQGGNGGAAGGVYNNGTPGSAAVWDSIIALNSPGPGGIGGFGISASGPNGVASTVPDVAGAFTSQGHNLIGVSNGSVGLTNGVNGNLVGTVNNPIHPRLGALQDNGGPTWTMSLLTGSPALDTGDDTLTGIDQRGFARWSGAHVDMGACEGVVPLFSRGEALLTGVGDNNSIVAIEVRSGATVGKMVQPGGGAAYQIAGPRGLLCVNNSLLVVNQNVDLPYNGEVLAFDLNTGVFSRKYVPSSNPSAPYAPRGMILGPNGVLYVADVGGFDGVHAGRIGRYNSLGQFLGNVSITGLGIPFYPMGLVIGPDGLLYVSGVGDLSQGSISGYVFRFQFNAGTQNYQYLNTLISSTAANFYAPGLHSPEGIVFGPDGNLFVTSFYASFNDAQAVPIVHRDAILVFDKNGQRLGAPIELYGTNQDRVFAQALLFGPRGDLFVPITSGGQVRRYSAASHFQQFTVLPSGGNPLTQPWYLTFRATNPGTLAYEAPKLTGIAMGESFQISWPAGYVGWQLQAQTNSLTTGLGSNWIDVAGSIGTNKVLLNRDPGTASVFYRLAAP